MNEINQQINNQKTKEAIDNFSEAMVNMAINGINEAIANERKKTEWWKRQAYVLHSKLGQCRDCSNKVAVKAADFYFENGGADCVDCPTEDNKPLK